MIKKYIFYLFFWIVNDERTRQVQNLFCCGQLKQNFFFIFVQQEENEEKKVRQSDYYFRCALCIIFTTFLLTNGSAGRRSRCLKHEQLHFFLVFNRNCFIFRWDFFLYFLMKLNMRFFPFDVCWANVIIDMTHTHRFEHGK